jgi:hypothetical protein
MDMKRHMFNFIFFNIHVGGYGKEEIIIKIKDI